MTRVKKIVAITVLFLVAPVAGYAADATYDITVKADGTKANGSPWDGIPALGNSRANLNAAPDIAVCVVKAKCEAGLYLASGRTSAFLAVPERLHLQVPRS